jgi:nitroreductase
MNDVLKAIAGRRSIRKFKVEQITDEELLAILEAGRQAPSGHNDQSCFFSVIQNRGLIEELSEGSKKEMQKAPIDWVARLGKNEKYNIYYDAPTVVIVAAKRDAISPAADACAAIENILIAAQSLGIGSCWIGFTRYFFTVPERYTKVMIPDGYVVHYGVALGFTSEEYHANPPVRKDEKFYHVIK